MLLEFNFEHYSDILTNKLITHLHSDVINLKPISIGIQGDWGSGKTTLLEAIYHKVQFQQFKSFEEKKPIIIPVIFNAWRFEKEEHLIIPLLKQLYYELLRSKESEGESLNDKIEHLNQNLADKLLSLVTGFETEIDLKFFKLKYVPKDTIIMSNGDL